MKDKKLNFFTRIERSILKDDFYRVIIKESLGKAIGYLVLLSLIIGVLSCIKPIYQTNKAIKLVMDHFESDIPYFELKNGELKVEGDMPIVFEEGFTITAIDTREQVDESILDGYQQGFLVTRTKMINKQGIERTEYSFDDFGKFEFNKEDIQDLLPKIRIFLAPLIILGIILGTIIGKLFGSLFVSLIGLIINSANNGKLKYGDVYKIGIYAMTLSSIVKFMIKQLPYKIPFLGSMFFFIYYGVVVIYIVKGMKSIKEERQGFQQSNI